MTLEKEPAAFWKTLAIMLTGVGTLLAGGTAAISMISPQSAENPAPEVVHGAPASPPSNPEPTPPVRAVEQSGTAQVGLEADQRWQKFFDQKGYGRYPMILRIEGRAGRMVNGTIAWPSLNHSVVSMEGEFVEDMSNATDLKRWNEVPGFELVE